MKFSLLISFTTISLWLFNNTSQAQVSFVSSSQELNRLAGRGVALADLNNDGFLDAFVVNEDGPEGNGYRLYWGDGDGQFVDSGQNLANPLSWGGKPCIADINGDSRLEVITGRTIWLDDGTSHFSANTNSFSDSDNAEFAQCALADLNGDGFLDFFTTAFGATDVNGRVYLNDGQGKFTVTTQRLGSGSQASVSLGDLNGDGHIDAVIAGWREQSSDPCPNRIWINDGKGNFTENGQVLDEAMRHVHGQVLGDIDGDGDLDLVFGIQTSAPYAHSYRNDGTGRFTAIQSCGTRSVEKVELGDLDNDGDLDMFLACNGPNEVWLNDGTGRFTNSKLKLGNEWSWGLALGDLNNDHQLDAFVVNMAFDMLTSDPWYIARGRLAEVWLNNTKEKINITYIANEGFLFSCVNQKIMIDGIFTESWGTYPIPTTEVLTKERNATSPFNHLDALLLTHNHLDHINPTYTIDHLKNDTTCKLIGPPQVNTLLKSAVGYNTISDRVFQILPSNSLAVDTTIQNIKFRIVSLPHSDNQAKDIQNLGYIFEMASIKILFVGDASETDLEVYRNLNLAAEKIDLTFLPYWFFDGVSGNKGLEIISYLQPKAIIMMHIANGKVSYYQNLVKTMSGLPPVYFMKSSMEVLSVTDSLWTTSVYDRRDERQYPPDFKLFNNYPNPFNPTTVISYRLSYDNRVRLKIYNTLGREIKTLVNSFQHAGEHSIVWDGTDDSNHSVGSGIYLYSLQTDEMSLQKKMLLVR